jgi:ABC-type transport system substrate-binding protein
MNTFRKATAGAALVAATLAGGAVGASLLGTANAQTATTTPAASSSTAAPSSQPTGQPTGQPPAQQDPSKGGHVANGITETLLTGDTATKVTAAAKAAVPGATIERVENDAEGATYEAHMVKADGTHVTVKVNADFSVKGVESGM